jgi:hypothetical protein
LHTDFAFCRFSPVAAHEKWHNSSDIRSLLTSG